MYYATARCGGFCLDKMAIINLKLEGSDADKLMLLCEKDVRFVAAKTLTQAAQVAQTEIKKHLHETFVLRKPNFEKSIKIRPATKQTMQSSVYTMAGFAALQQTGGKQVAQSGRLAVPQYDSLHDVKAGRKSNPAGSFLMQTGSGAHIIAMRKDSGLRILYYLKSLVHMPKRLNMIEIAEKTAVTHVPRLFSDNLSQIFNFDVSVIIDRQEGDYYIGRTEYDSPEVDGEVLIPINSKNSKADAPELEAGNFYNATITSADEFDLYGDIIR